MGISSLQSLGGDLVLCILILSHGTRGILGCASLFSWAPVSPATASPPWPCYQKGFQWPQGPWQPALGAWMWRDCSTWPHARAVVVQSRLLLRVVKHRGVQPLSELLQPIRSMIHELKSL